MNVYEYFEYKDDAGRRKWIQRLLQDRRIDAEAKIVGLALFDEYVKVIVENGPSRWIHDDLLEHATALSSEQVAKAAAALEAAGWIVRTLKHAEDGTTDYMLCLKLPPPEPFSQDILVRHGSTLTQAA